MRASGTARWPVMAMLATCACACSSAALTGDPPGDVARCEDVFTAVDPGLPLPGWGVVPDEDMASLAGTRAGTLVWHTSNDAISFEPSEAEVQVVVDVRCADPLFLTRTKTAGRGRLACTDQLILRCRVDIVTDDHALQESLEVDAVRVLGSLPTYGMQIDLGELAGSFRWDLHDPAAWERSRIGAHLVFPVGHPEMEGAIDIFAFGPEEPTAPDSNMITQQIRSATAATWVATRP